MSDPSYADEWLEKFKAVFDRQLDAALLILTLAVALALIMHYWPTSPGDDKSDPNSDAGGEN